MVSIVEFPTHISPKWALFLHWKRLRLTNDLLAAATEDLLELDRNFSRSAGVICVFDLTESEKNKRAKQYVYAKILAFFSLSSWKAIWCGMKIQYQDLRRRCGAINFIGEKCTKNSSHSEADRLKLIQI